MSENIATLRDIEATLNDYKSGFDKSLESVSAGFADIKDDIKKALQPDEVKTAAEVKEDADMGAVAGIGNITQMEVFNIPIGKAVIGGLSAVFVSELVDGFLIAQSNMVQGLVKLGVAGATLKWGKRWLGAAGAGAFALLLTYDGIRHILPIDQWGARGATALTGLIPARGLGGNKISTVPMAAARGGGYYAGLKG